jgi:hypothetical protein
MSNKLYVLAAALTGCAVAASAVFIRQRSRREALLQHKEDLRTWESEGGKPAPVAARPAPAL